MLPNFWESEVLIVISLAGSKEGWWNNYGAFQSM